MEKEQCLVTVGVVTYNSSKYVIETLNSIYNQTYEMIELIVSDDGSKDNTVEIVNNWVDIHSARFVHARVLTVANNTGTSSNMNRIINASNGTWLKFIAGDDVLLPDGIKKVMDYVYDKNEINWLFAKSIFYKNIISDDNIIKEELTRYDAEIYKQTASIQYKRMMVGNPFVGPGHFFKAELLKDVNGFDEEFGILEDYPMWLKLLGKGERCFFFDEFVAGYRLADSNVCANNQRIVNKKLAILLYAAKKKYLFGKTSKKIEWHARFRYATDMLFSTPILNKQSPKRLALYNFACKLNTRLLH